MMATLSNTVTHIAGDIVTIEGRIIQRCSCCGFKLLDSKKKLTPREQKTFPIFGTAALVRILIDKEQYEVLPYDPKQKIPKDLCIDLVEE